MDMRTAEALAAQGATSTYLVADATDTAGPVLDVTVSGHNKANVEKTLLAVTNEITTKLNAIQAGLNANSMIRDNVITFAPEPIAQKSKKVKPVLVAFALGLVLSIAIPVMVDGQRAQRQASDEDVAAEGAAYPLGRVASEGRRSSSGRSPSLVVSGSGRASRATRGPGRAKHE